MASNAKGSCEQPKLTDVCTQGQQRSIIDPATGQWIFVYEHRCVGGYGTICYYDLSMGPTQIRPSSQTNSTSHGTSILLLRAPSPPPPPPPVCPITDILPFGPPDPPALDMTNISPLARSAADCLLAGLGIVNIGGAGDRQVFSSGFRTLEYQQHFADLWRKWNYELKNNTDERCVELKKKIGDDFKLHNLGGDLPPTDPSKIPNNCHSSGTCFDVNSAYIPGVDQNSFACKVERPYPVKDKWHVVPF